MVTNASELRRAVRLHARIGLLIFALPLLVGCAMFKKYDMAQIHQESAARPERNPVIFIHGFVGSKLKNSQTHESVWGRFLNAIKRGKTDDLSLPIDSLVLSENRDGLVPYAIYESVAGVKFYGALLDALEQVGGYRRGDINNPRPEDTLFVYCYDWRRDNVEAAIGLGRAIQQIKGRLKVPGLRFDIVAHSMGGLVAEYYLKYGTEDVLRDGLVHPVTYAGAPNLGRMILVGTPQRGTMHAFRILNTGFARTMSTEVVFTMPSLYQLLPEDGREHFVDPQGNALDVDLYDASTWVRSGWSVFNSRQRASRLRKGLAINGALPAGNPGDAQTAQMARFLQAALDRSRALHAALKRDAPEGSPVPIHVFGADCIPTLDRVVLKPTSSGLLTLFDDEASPERAARQLDKVIRSPGDGTVTADSLLDIDPATDSGEKTARSPGGFASTFFFCESHGFLSANKSFQDNLFYVLFSGTPRPASFAVRSAGKR